MNCIDQVITDRYSIFNGDCVQVLRGLPDHSVGYSIFSPPFASLYTYSNSPRDMGNVRDDAEFFDHFAFLIKELRRVMKPGRDVSFHCMLMPASKQRDGHIGLKDFRGDLIRAFQAEGFIYHSEVCIWKDPVTAMQRTKALGLLHKSVRENAAMCRQGIPDYLVTMRSPGECERVTHDRDEYPVDLWQKVASPVWMDINPSDTLQFRSAREHDDERLDDLARHGGQLGQGVVELDELGDRGVEAQRLVVLAAAAALAMGEANELTPLAVIRGVPYLDNPKPSPDSFEVPLEKDLYAPFLKNKNWRKAAEASGRG